MQERRTNAQRRDETRAALIGAARDLFLEQGYAATGTPDVVARAGVTRGALYHHFADKQALFHAVVADEAAQIAAEIEAGSATSADAIGALRDGAAAYFAAMRAPGRTRLMLLEAPAVLGPETMRRIDAETGARTLRDGISETLGPAAAPDDIAAIADLVSAMFDRAAMAVSTGADESIYQDAIARLLVLLAR